VLPASSELLRDNHDIPHETSLGEAKWPIISCIVSYRYFVLYVPLGQHLACKVTTKRLCTPRYESSPPPSEFTWIYWRESPPCLFPPSVTVRLRIFCVHTALQLWGKWAHGKRTGIIENPARTLELPLLVRSVGSIIIFSFYLSQLRGRKRIFSLRSLSPFYSKGGNSGRPNQHHSQLLQFLQESHATAAKERKKERRKVTSEKSEKVKLGKRKR